MVDLKLFKPSPFYTFQAQVGKTELLDSKLQRLKARDARLTWEIVMANHRNTVTINIRVRDSAMLSQVSADPTLRVMVFCAAENRGPQDVAFPHQSEIKVNGGEVKANLRGLKNKPGSTRPVDITKELRLNPKTPDYLNKVEITYALTTKVDGYSIQVSCQYTPPIYLIFPHYFTLLRRTMRLCMLTSW